MVTRQDIESAFLEGLLKGPKVVSRFMKTKTDVWNKTVTAALVKAGKRVVPDACVAAEDHKDGFGRSGYFDVDVTVYENKSWGQVLMMAEHEAGHSRLDVQIAAWKLLNIWPERRVLVAYYKEGSAVGSFDILHELVCEVANRHRGKEILLIGADRGATPGTPEELRAAYQSTSIRLLPAIR